MFLDPQEIRDLTGLEQPAAQERLLRSWGLTVFRNRANRVMLAREALTQFQIGVRLTKESPEPRLRLKKAA
jgi:hypothetical protein